MSKKGVFLLLYLFAIGCGVRGDPQPPLKPTELGRGHPTFKQAMKKIQIPHDEKSKLKENEEKDENYQEE